MTGQYLCQLAGDWRGDLPPGGAMIEEKRDGWRALWFRGIDGQPRLWSRQGHPIEGTGHIAHRLALIEAAAGEALFIDGEFQVAGSLEATKRWCETGWKQGGEAGEFFAFDCLTQAEWRAGGTDRPLYQRKARLAELVRAVNQDAATAWDWRPGSRGRDQGATPVRVIPDEWAFTPGDVADAVHRVWAQGGEGVMVKDPLTPYLRRRTDAWQKVKPHGPWWRKGDRGATSISRKENVWQGN